MGKFDFRNPSRPIRVPWWAGLWARLRIRTGRWLSPQAAIRWARLSRRIEMWMHPWRSRRMTVLMQRLLPVGTGRREAHRLMLTSRSIRRVGGHTFSPVAGRDRQWLLETLRPEGLEFLAAVQQAGRGAIVLGTHAGLNSWVGPVLLGLGYPVRLTQRRTVSAEKYLLFQRYGWVDRVLPFPEPGDAGPHLKLLTDLTRRGEWVQHVATAPRPPGGLVGTILGRQVHCCPAPWAIARLTGAPVFPALVLADADLRPRLVVGPPQTIAREDPAAAAIERAFRGYLDFVNERLAAAPWNVSLLVWGNFAAPR